MSRWLFLALVQRTDVAYLHTHVSEHVIYRIELRNISKQIASESVFVSARSWV